MRKKLNLQHGDVVALVMPNRPESALAVLGILEAGLTVTSMNPMYTSGKRLMDLGTYKSKYKSERQ